MTDEEAIETRVREELYAKAVDAVALRLRMAEVGELNGILTRRSEHLRDVAGIMAQLASELLGVSSFDVWAEARKTVDAIKG
ncbi:hypothetical protein [Paratractidigestivibacter faecalis]|uniref:Uncharacterized protein n=1 Tax=Paratractidigestivibacter faecalis TaxID=2292441 RepID=A0ABV1IDP8_9ACTN